MNLEALTLNLQTKYLQKELVGSKIYRVFMPSPHAVMLMLKRERDTVALLADMNGGSPALYIPDRLPENPEIPPAFCMLLRKHIEEGRLASIEQSELDRVITLEIDMLGASSKIITKKLVIELAGKNANVILTQDNVIIDCLKHVGLAQSSYRQLLPGREYTMPPAQKGMNILTEAPLDLVRAANNVPAATFLKAFIGTSLGIGKATALEMLLAADLLPNMTHLSAEAEEMLAKQIELLQLRMQAEKQSVYALIGRTNQVKTILVLPPQALEEGMRVQEFADINSAINYSMSLKPIQLPQHEQIGKLVANELQRLQKKLQALEKDLAAANNADEQRIIADSLMASIYMIKKGQLSAKIMNIYDGEEMTVALSPVLSPVDNAQAYYKRYNKYKRAQTEVALQQESTKEMLEYLASIEASLQTASTKAEIEEVRQELISIGLIKEFGKKKANFKLPKSMPMHIKLNEFAELYIGKNNKQNDYVTFTVAGPRDWWFHTKDIPGSHVVLKTDLSEPREEDLALALQFAAHFSKASTGSNVPVDCVQRKFVKKPSGSKPGFVIFTNNKTHYINPDEQKIAKYLDKVK